MKTGFRQQQSGREGAATISNDDNLLFEGNPTSRRDCDLLFDSLLLWSPSSWATRSRAPAAGDKTARPVGRIAERMQLSVSLAAVSSPERVQWNGYDLHLGELIGAGAFSSVHAVENSPRELGALAAKVITLEKTSGVSEEAALLESICHPHILRCYGSVLLDHRWHVLLLERAHGGELFERVQYLEQLEQQLCARWVGQLLDALEHLHSVGVIHRDLKPENLLLSSSGPDSSLKVADLGTAKRSNDMTGLHTPCGSRGYAAPEQVLPLYGQHAAFYGRAADLWSCGVVAYVLLTGTMPFDPASVDPSTPVRAPELEATDTLNPPTPPHTTDTHPPQRRSRPRPAPACSAPRPAVIPSPPPRDRRPLPSCGCPPNSWARSTRTRSRSFAPSSSSSPRCAPPLPTPAPTPGSRRRARRQSPSC